MGPLYGIVNPGKSFRVVIEGHSDEISWMVNYITDDGFYLCHSEMVELINPFPLKECKYTLQME